MESLSILIMNWRDIRNPDAGGAEVFTHEVAKRWADWGHNVTLVTSRYKGAASDEVVDGVKVMREGNPITVYSRARRAYLGLRRRTDVVIDEINTRPFFAPKYVDGGTPVFALIYQLAKEFWSYETPFPLSVIGRYWLEERWLRPYRSLPTFTISQSTQRDLMAFGFRNIIVVPVGSSIQHLDGVPQKESQPTFLYVGRLRKAKLPDHALRAFAIVKKSLPDAQLWVVGEGYLRRTLERHAPSGVVFHGRVSESEKIRLMSRAHIMLFPAVREGWGLTILEANSLGTPVVGYDVNGLRDSISPGKTGILVPFGDIQGLAQAAIMLITHQDRWTAMVMAAQRWAGGFNWATTAIEMLNAISSEATEAQPLSGKRDEIPYAHRVGNHPN